MRKMINNHIFRLLFVSMLTVYTSTVFAENTITIDTPMDAPVWAVKEREVLARNAEMMYAFADKYIDPETGWFECVEHWGGIDGPDDVMESFYNWPMVYLLGGDAGLLDLFTFIWEGHLDQYTALGMYDREFVTSFDWEHTGEGIQPFLLLPLCDPADRVTRTRTVRFANFYTGRDPETRNYDPRRKIIRSIHNGSRGPRFNPTQKDWHGRDEHIEWWQDWIDAPTAGDVPMNFHATSLAANALILTGDHHYREWIYDYMGAWRDRTIENGGNVPSIVGLDGKIGSGWDGKWYGGLMGWNWKFGGWGILGRGVRIGFTNAFYMTANPSFYEVLRAQGRNLLNSAGGNGRYHGKFGPEGWYGGDSRSLLEGLFSDIYQATLEPDDLDRLLESADLDSARRRGDRIWRHEYEDGRFEGGNEVVWFDYLNGLFDSYPEKALDDALDRLKYYHTGMAADTSTPETRQADTPHVIRVSREAPLGIIGAVTGALTNLAMGGSAPLWSGGLLWCQLRYFDPENERPGLPPQTAALITAVKPDYVKVTLVNLNPEERRTMIIQTGAYGEHQCTRVITDNGATIINSRFFTVELAPGSGGELTIFRDRNVNKPTFAFPWHEELWYPDLGSN